MDSTRGSEAVVVPSSREQLGHPFGAATRKPTITATGVSSIQRKPKVTYRSPSGSVTGDVRVEGPNGRALVVKLVSSSPSSAAKTSDRLAIQPSTTARAVGQGVVETSGVSKRKKYPMGPPLPLYHPLGRLALSLPELDPTTLGLPAPMMRMDESIRRSSARARRPAAKLREAEVDEETGRYTPENVAMAVAMAMATGNAASPGPLPLPPPPGPAAAAVPMREAKERLSPRKRRSGGGGGKRKRREMDDGDSAYPAKRSRNPRGVKEVAREASVEGESVATGGGAGEEGAVGGGGEEMGAVSEEKKPERRSTRSRGVQKRRGSSTSETTSTGSVPIIN